MCEYLVNIVKFIFTLDKDQCGSKYISRISILLLCNVCFKVVQEQEEEEREGKIEKGGYYFRCYCIGPRE